MTSKNQLPTTLQQAIVQFSDEEMCIQFVASMRWPDGDVVCPHCNQKGAGYLKTQRRWKCKNRECRKQFSVKVGTIFEDSAIALSKWLPVVWLVTNCKNGVSSYQIHRAPGVTQKTAWFMLQRVRLAMQDEDGGKLGGEVEVDETYIGGLARNMHKSRRLAKFQHGAKTGGSNKVGVMGLLERGKNGRASRVKTQVVGRFDAASMQSEIRKRVEPGSTVYTDEYGSYKTLGYDGTFKHDFIRHAVTYVSGNVHTNGIENFWSLLKRGLRGTYVSVEPFHMFRYLDEQMFRFNEREDNDLGRFLKVMKGVAGRRLTFKELTGKAGEPTPAQP